MRNPDDAVEKVLDGLRKTELPVGFEGCVLRGVEDRLAEREGSAWFGWSARRFVLAGACLTGLVAIWIGFSVRHQAEAPKVQSARVESVPSMPTVPHALVPKVALSVEARPSVVRLREARAVAAPKVAEASFPAPPMPLTDQERLLLRVVHHGDPEQVAMLHPRLLDPLSAKDVSDFQQFFDEVPKGDHK